MLRHTFASSLIAQAHVVVCVSRQLGHANAAITLKVYAHWFDAARHARQRLSEDYRDVLRRREAPGASSGLSSARSPYFPLVIRGAAEGSSAQLAEAQSRPLG